LVGCVLVASFLQNSHAIAEPGFRQDEIRFDIASQSLADALSIYARITGVEVIVDDGVLSGRRSRAINGMFHPTIALRRMKRGRNFDRFRC
jgi:hypothetical protein